MGNSRLRHICLNSSVLLILGLPLLIPFDASRNTDMQGLILLIAGSLSWLAIALGPKSNWGQLAKTETFFLILFGLACVISTAVNPHKAYDILGSPYIRLGSASFLACIGCGLALRQFTTKQLVKYLYADICLLALVSLPYSLIKFNGLGRAPGIFAQADVLACFLGCGLLLGLHLWLAYPKWRPLIASSQLLLAGLLLLTQTRAVLLLVIVLWLFWELWQKRAHSIKYMAGLTASLIILLSLSHFLPSRLTNLPFAASSLDYRLSLQKYAIKSSWQKPVLGYGPGNLADALACPKLQAPALQQTCQKGYFFNSSHNIFLDRVLAVGWLGGLAFLLFVATRLYYQLRSADLRIIGLVGLLIALYYFTNVTSATLELLFWILLLRLVSSASASQ